MFYFSRTLLKTAKNRIYMFGKKKNSTSGIGNSSNNVEESSFQNQTSVITQGTRIEGKVQSSDSIRIDGHIIGEVHCKNKLVIGPSGKIEGDVRAGDCNSSGSIEGNTTIAGTMNLTSTAKFKGILNAQKLNVDEGAQCSGELNVGTSGTPKPLKKEGITHINS